MPQVKEFFDSLSVEQKRNFSVGLVGGEERVKETTTKILLFLQNQNLDGDIADNASQFCDLLLKRVQKKLQEKKDIGEKDEREHIAAEEKRVDDVVRRHKELHPPKTRECPVCLDDVEITEHNSMIYFYCCGQGTCYTCFKKNRDSNGELFQAKCPLCRSTITNEAVTRANRIKKCAEKGLSWAQLKMSQYCLAGSEEANIPIDEKKSTEWLQLAAENSSPDLDAITSLSRAYRVGKEVEKSKEKADALMKKAADMGSRRAQDSVAIHLLWDNEKNVVTADAVYYATLATGERPNFIHFGAGIYSAYVLGLAFNYGQGGMEINSYLARHYFKIAVQGNTNASEHAEMNFPEGYEGAYCFYGEALITLGLEQYGGTSVPGFSPIPKAMYWFHKASTLGCGGCDNPACSKETARRRGRSWMDAVKLEESKRCSYCLKLAEDCLGGKLKNCARCLGAWYCGRDCQAAAWKAGHKLDCVKLSGPREAALH